MTEGGGGGLVNSTTIFIVYSTYVSYRMVYLIAGLGGVAFYFKKEFYFWGSLYVNYVGSLVLKCIILKWL